MMKSFVDANWTIQRLERACSAAASLFLFAIMLIIVADVALRYLFNSPLSWAFDAISMYLMVGVFYFSLSDTLAASGHVNVDLLYQRAPPPVRRAIDCLGSALMCAVFAAIAYQAGVGAWQSWVSAEVVAGSIAWPVWITRLLVALGSALIVLRLALMVFCAFGPLCARDRNTKAADEGSGEAAY